ncbi:flavin-dependent oxidoreductase [Saccharopolyspora sp. K220]|uniref:flavin-dependent oxidoreductase n=1 Tax=Saccharopolyspora soli TaxID=2926618 RepID=UPI001F5A7851|nr:flavin-dependent oxidoreductase [Saccharopolyspora soli]MCI2417405.1 flavin-dependent oxidoreductase [Saccharopolyspora soli]
MTIVGAGIGGLTLALELHEANIDCTVVEAAESIAGIGVGINVLPHAMRILTALGVADRLEEVGVTTKESVFFNRFGQLVHREPNGRYAGYDYPQLSLHRGDLQKVLLDAVRERLGADSVQTGQRCVGFAQDAHGVDAELEGPTGTTRLRSDVLIGCDGVHSAIRKQLYPAEGEPRYSGINMWRGVARWKPFLSGASMVRAGWFTTGKLVVYPIRENIDEAGSQLVNWVVEIETPRHLTRDWNRVGQLEDFASAFDDWHFDWLDVPALLRASDTVLEYPMVDQDPLEKWSFDRVTLLGDAAHPMVPRGSNGAGQAILDAHALRTALESGGDPVAALASYEQVRLPATGEVVRMNRTNPPDAILREVWSRTGDQPFQHIDEVISERELAEISDRYKQVAGYSRDAFRDVP